MADDEANGCAFLWKIKNISHSCWGPETQTSSPTFTADALEGTRWLLLLCPMGNTESNKGETFIGVYLHRSKSCSGPNDIEVQFQLAFLGKDASLLTEETTKHNFQKDSNFGFPEFEERKLVFATNKEAFLPDDTLTVQCVIWENENKPEKPKRFYGQTVFRVNRRSFVWRIDDFSTRKSGLKNEFIDDSLKFHLVLNEGLDFDKKLLLNIDLCYANLKYFSFKISIVDSEGKKEDYGTHEYFIDDLNKGVASTLLFFKKLMDEKNRYIPNDVLTLDCEYVYSDASISYEYCGYGIIFPDFKSEAENRTECNKVMENTRNTKSLVEKMKFMYDDAICSDIVLRTSTQTFPAHKAILSASSPVFKRMFINDMEKNRGHIDITDFEDDTILRMLMYIYTDSLEDLHFGAAIKLSAIADKYQILSLRNRCSSLVKSKFSDTNACDILFLADLHHDDDLKTAVVDYILAQRKQILCSQEWKDFMSSHLKLAADVMYKKIFQE